MRTRRMLVAGVISATAVLAVVAANLPADASEHRRRHHQQGGSAPAGWNLTWSYKDLVSGYQIAMVMPEKLQPGPLAGKISLFAPVSLFFFFFLFISFCL